MGDAGSMKLVSHTRVGGFESNKTETMSTIKRTVEWEDNMIAWDGFWVPGEDERTPERVTEDEEILRRRREGVAMDIEIPPRRGEVHLLGPPGCGKTHELAYNEIPYAVKLFGASGILLISMTVVGAEELANRQTVDVPEKRIRTLHSLCLGILRSNRVGAGSKAPDVWKPGSKDPKNQKSQELDEKWRVLVQEDHPTWVVPDGFDDDPIDGEEGETWPLMHSSLLFMQCCMTPVSVDTTTDMTVEFHRTLTAFKLRENAVELGDLAEIVYREDLPLPYLDGCKVEALFVDEAQDLSELEFALVRQWLPDLHTLVLAGDPDQAIFKFRGACPEDFHDPTTWAGETTELGQSYRLPPAIHAYAERTHTAWDPKRVGVEYAPRTPSNVGSVGMEQCSMATHHRRDLGALVRREIAALDALGCEGVHSDVMILGSTGQIVWNAIRALQIAGILYHNPYRPESPGWNPGAAAREAVFALVNGVADGSRLWTWREFAAWTAPCRARGFLVHGKRTMLDDITETAVLDAAMTEADVRATVIDADYLLGDVVPTLRGGSLEPLEWFLESLLKGRRDAMAAPIKAFRVSGFAAVSTPPRVVVGTIHSVKGATAGSVILSPSLSAYSAPSSPDVARTMYVAMTRASERLCLLRPGGGARTGKSVEWLRL